MDVQPDRRVVVDRPEEQSLLGLLMRDLLDKNLGRASVYARVRALEGDVRIRAGEMTVTLRFGEGRVTVVEGATERPRAQVSGSVPALLGVARGGGLVGPVLARGIRVRGSPFVLLRLLPLLRPSQDPAERTTEA